MTFKDVIEQNFEPQAYMLYTPHRKKNIVKLTNTWSFCLQKRTLLKTIRLSISQFDYSFFQCKYFVVLCRHWR